MLEPGLVAAGHSSGRGREMLQEGGGGGGGTRKNLLAGEVCVAGGLGEGK